MLTSSWSSLRARSITRALIGSSMLLASQSGCGREPALESMDDFVEKSGWLTASADGHRADYDGDLISDYVVYRPTIGAWYLNQSTAGYLSGYWGNGTDWPIQSDFDGDGKTDFGVWRPSTSEWFVLYSSTNN